MNDITNNVMNIPATNVLNQENQDYYNLRDQQYIAYKYESGLEWVTFELVPNIILEEEEEGVYQWTDKYNQWDYTYYTLVEEDGTGGSHTFNVDNRVFNITKTKQMGNQRQELSVKCLNKVTSCIFILTNVNHKYGTFDVNY